MNQVRELSDGQKLQIINDSRKYKRKWNKLGKEQKYKVLAGMDIATYDRWMLTLFEEAKIKDDK
jgi:hypothetical protein